MMTWNMKSTRTIASAAWIRVNPQRTQVFWSWSWSLARDYTRENVALMLSRKFHPPGTSKAWRTRLFQPTITHLMLLNPQRKISLPTPASLTSQVFHRSLKILKTVIYLTGKLDHIRRHPRTELMPLPTLDLAPAQMHQVALQEPLSSSILQTSWRGHWRSKLQQRWKDASSSSTRRKTKTL